MVVEASVWVSALDAQDVHHAVSRRWLQQHMDAQERLLTPTLALAEVAGAVAHRTGVAELGRQAAEQVAHVPGLQLAGLDVGLGTEAARFAAEYHLRGADAVYAALAHTLNVLLFTWDDEIRARATFIRVSRPRA